MVHSAGRVLAGAAAVALVLLGSVGVATAATGDGIDTRDEALAAITDGLALVDDGQAKITAGRDWLAANPPPAPEPEPEPTPEPEPEPAPITATATVVAGEDEARVDWQTSRTDITGWHIGRDGTDTTGYGAWSTELPADARTWTFDLLRAGATYTFTLTPLTAGGELAPVVTEVTMPGGTTEPEPTEPPTTEDPPPAGTGDTAAERYGWGEPIAAGSDEFNGTSIDGSKWSQAGECWEGHAGNGQRCASNSTVQDGFLRQHGEANGDSGWLASKFGQKYGHWEVRARSMPAPGATGHPLHPVLITWPDSNQWPAGAEYDYLENGAPGQQCAEAYLHYPNHQPKRQEHAEKCGVDLTQWHNFGFSWQPDGLTGYIDGVEWFHFDQNCIQCAPGPMHQTIQLDQFHGDGGYQEAFFDVDWARVYAP